ncbi:hypothetical protein COV19_00115 [Candidatus Woesearchaeota archaeon CG10_big_fil_rev_8_21_14_0_10_44_13]|nr:MAG: hypothetical protein COV19_00115 [Candidatus Woesearchaeota archaeon CG10_big_fil_rev_8_21_14_0_10_44_13]
MLHKFTQLKKEYDSYSVSLIPKHKLLRETSLGYYGSAPADPVFNFFRKMELEKKKSFLDLGSGDGKVVLIAALFTKAAGIEIDMELIKVSGKMKKKLGIRAEFLREDYLMHDLSKYEILFLNPDQPFYALEKKLRKEMKKTARLVVLGNLYRPLNMGLEKNRIIDGTSFSIYKN